MLVRGVGRNRGETDPGLLAAGGGGEGRMPRTHRPGGHSETLGWSLPQACNMGKLPQTVITAPMSPSWSVGWGVWAGGLCAPETTFQLTRSSASQRHS